MRFLTVVVLAFCLAIVSCGGGYSGNSGSNGYSLNGNIGMTGTSQAVTAKLVFVGGAAQTDSAGHFTAKFSVFESASQCFGVSGVGLAITGTINAQGQLNAATGAVNPPNITLTGSVSPDGKTISSGSYSITAVPGSATCAAGDHGFLSGFQVQPFTGTYTGSFILTGGTSSGPTVNVSAPLVQSTMADSFGLYHFNAATITFTYPGTSCSFTSATLDTVNSAATGAALLLNANGNDGSQISFVGQASDGSAKTVPGALDVSGGSATCNNLTGSGTLQDP
jgi:hypothetical protein